MKSDILIALVMALLITLVVIVTGLAAWSTGAWDKAATEEVAE